MQEIEVDINTRENVAIVVDGQSLAFALQNVKGKLRLQEICLKCSSVLCCRMSPLQKAEVVKMVRESPGNPITAAIGDGGNDASMIQEADVGIGIFGKEGRQASRVADFAFGRFHFLRRALLVHGFLYYSRIAMLIQYFFYKNSVFTNSQIMFSFFNKFSARTLYDSISLTLYNITYTSLPIFLYGVFENSRSIAELSSNPTLYKIHRRNSSLSWIKFALWFLDAAWHNAVCFYGPFLLYSCNGGVASSSGEGIGYLNFGAMVITATVILVNAKLCIVVSLPMKLPAYAVIGYIITMGGYFFVIALWNGLYVPSFGNQENYWAYYEIFSMPSTWILIVLILGIGLFPDILAKVIPNLLYMKPLCKYPCAKNNLEPVPTKQDDQQQPPKQSNSEMIEMN